MTKLPQNTTKSPFNKLLKVYWNKWIIDTPPRANQNIYIYTALDVHEKSDNNILTPGVG